MVLLITEGLISVAVITKRIRENNSAASSLRLQAEWFVSGGIGKLELMSGMNECKYKVVIIIRFVQHGSFLW